MHHEIVRDTPGSCPICGMDLIAFGGQEDAILDIDLNTLLRPTDSYVLSTIPVTTLTEKEVQMEVQALGTIAYDTRATGTVSANVSGRIEKLYLRYTFQEVRKGQKLMDIYSPELLTAEQNLLFLVKNDPDNHSFIQAAKEKLLLLGVTADQIDKIIREQKTFYTIPVYSNYTGHIHDAFNKTGEMPGGSSPEITRDLLLKEGMYVQKGQPVLTIFNPNRLWAILNIYADNQRQVKLGDQVEMVAETTPGKKIRAKINFIEPFFQPASKTLTARVYFDNPGAGIPVGSQVTATIRGDKIRAFWLPKEAVISLGLEKLVFRKEADVFKAHKVVTGLQYKDSIQIVDGLDPADQVATNAQYLMDSESFIKIKE
ncbi:MAG: efflux RND transporter periplasmic adaptor subunit [Bacteroidota bacterium]|nr:efflux RND transporter periplasmic adaptor subunit [Bacteroidota bacterium]